MAGLSSLICVVARILYGSSTSVAAGAGLALSFTLSVTNTMGWMVGMTAEIETQMNAVRRVLKY